MLWPLRAEFSTSYAAGRGRGPGPVRAGGVRRHRLGHADARDGRGRAVDRSQQAVAAGGARRFDRRVRPGSPARVLPVAHRFLSKPCETDLLRTTIQRSCALRDVLRSPEIQAVATGMSSLPTLPEFHRRVVDELELAEPSMSRVGEIVGKDVAMTTKLIQVANSPLFGRRWPAVSPTQAVVALGSDMTRTIIMAGSLFSRLSPRAAARFRMTELWDHSRRVADLAKRVAETWDVSPRVSQDAATAGFLHEVGRLVFADRLPDRYYGVVRRADRRGNHDRGSGDPGVRRHPRRGRGVPARPVGPAGRGHRGDRLAAHARPVPGVRARASWPPSTWPMP